MINSRAKKEGAGGAGLVLSRKTGQNFRIKGDPDATDEEILAAMRGPGINIRLVEITSMGRKFHNAPVHVDGNPSQDSSPRDGAVAVAVYDGTKGSAKIGIRAPTVLAIEREEIIKHDDLPEIARAYAG